MGFFSSPCESEVEKATDDKNTSEEWSSIMEICDKAGKSSQEAKDYLKAILKRINHADPHVSLQAVTLLDACVKNCGKTFHIEVASRDFENEYIKLIKKSHVKVVQKLKESLKKWSEGEFKSDIQLALIPSLYLRLKQGGTDFNVEEGKRTVVLSKDPNVVQSQEEEDQIAKAIELSLKETSGSPRNTVAAPTTTSLYPVAANMSAAMALPPKDQRKVRAIYDFEAAEDNELTFSIGEIIFIIDDSDQNWWKGSNQRGEGLFPANFVTADLSLDPTLLVNEKQKKLVMLDESLDKKLDDIKEPENIEIDESKIDRLLHLFHEADPANAEQDTKEMLGLEREVNSMNVLIDKELERVDRKHAQLTQLSTDLVEALNLYHTLMREPQFPASIPITKMPFGYQPPNSQAATGHSMMYSHNGTLPHQPPQRMGPPPPSMMTYNTMPHDRSFIPPAGPNMPPPQYSLPPQGLPPPPGHNMPGSAAPPGSMPPAMSAPPGSLPPTMSAPPPHMQMHGHPPHMMEDPRIPGPFPPQAFNLAGFPGHHLQSSLTHIQNGPPGPQNFSMPPTSNTHIM